MKDDASVLEMDVLLAPYFGTNTGFSSLRLGVSSSDDSSSDPEDVSSDDPSLSYRIKVFFDRVSYHCQIFLSATRSVYTTW